MSTNIKAVWSASMSARRAMPKYSGDVAQSASHTKAILSEKSRFNAQNPNSSTSTKAKPDAKLSA